MHKLVLLPLFVLVLLTSCEKKEPFVYDYEDNPVYTRGYADFWGDYYQANNIDENVLSLSLFTRNLLVDTLTGSLKGTGQYLYLEDIFVAPVDTLLPEGTYTVSTTAAPFRIARGRELDVDGLKFEIGAFVYFVEPNELYTVTKFISSGTMKVVNAGIITRIDFDFTLNDSTRLKGHFEDPLPYYDSRFSTSMGGAFSNVKFNRRVRNSVTRLQ
jgi:hypothetical protein